LTAIRKTPEDWIAQAQLAEIDVEARVLDPKTWHAAREAVALAPRQARAQLALANVAVLAEDWVTAKASFERALVLEPDNPDTARLLAIAIEKAPTGLGPVEPIQRDPNSPEALRAAGGLTEVALWFSSTPLFLLAIATIVMFGLAGPEGPTLVGRLVLIVGTSIPFVLWVLGAARWETRTAIPAWPLLLRVGKRYPRIALCALLLVAGYAWIAGAALFGHKGGWLLAPVMLFLATRLLVRSRLSRALRT
jgi:hypothetical protein